jgi:hypothetical protein
MKGKKKNNNNNKNNNNLKQNYATYLQLVQTEKIKIKKII